jgi:hypothetical protein
VTLANSAATALREMILCGMIPPVPAAATGRDDLLFSGMVASETKNVRQGNVASLRRYPTFAQDLRWHREISGDRASVMQRYFAAPETES